MSNREYVPDRWVVVRIKPPGEEEWFRVFGGWYGGFTQGDSWKLSSGIVKAIDHPDHYEVHNTSGSIYKCWKGTLDDGSRGGDLGMSAYMMSIYQHYKAQYEAQQVVFETVDFMPLLEKPAA